MSEETVAQKITSLQRCVSQARVALSTAGSDFKTNYLLQDAAVLNIIRACETALDLANMLIRKRRLGIPSESRESFGILVREQLLEQSLGSRPAALQGDCMKAKQLFDQAEKKGACVCAADRQLCEPPQK
jgi:uncharacterized protein YutE (UPF0331/DUF86 family)